MNDIDESKCWSCARAYALSDPLGCAFHRKEHRRIWDKAVIKEHLAKGGRICITIRVTKCPHYNRSERYFQDLADQAAEIARTQFKRKEGDAVGPIQ